MNFLITKLLECLKIYPVAHLNNWRGWVSIDLSGLHGFSPLYHTPSQNSSGLQFLHHKFFH